MTDCQIQLNTAKPAKAATGPMLVGLIELVVVARHNISTDRYILSHIVLLFFFIFLLSQIGKISFRSRTAAH